MFSALLQEKNREYSPFQVKVLFLGQRHLRSPLTNASKGFVWFSKAIKGHEGHHFTHAGLEKCGFSLLLKCAAEMNIE